MEDANPISHIPYPKLGHGASQGPMVEALVGRRDEAFEQRVRLVRFAVKFRVKLAGDEEWMLG